MDDSRIIRMFFDRAEGAIDALERKLGKLLYKIAVNILEDPREAEECVSEVTHAARMSIDEKGVTAAAFTLILRCGTSMPPDERIEFVLDRPFVFVVESQDGLPLFAGTVYEP